MDPAAVAVTDRSQVSEARRAGALLASRLGYDETRAGELAIVITELATNLVKHARDGEVIIRSLQSAGTQGIEVLSLDRGPGIVDVARALSDGYSSVGSSGNGLGAVRRIASGFDLYTQPGSGTAAVARVWKDAAPTSTPCEPALAGGVRTAKAGELRCGDAWACVGTANRNTVLVVDGLGHGPHAAHAAEAAVEGLYANPEVAPPDLMPMLHARLRSTRGAAAMVVLLDYAARQMHYAGVGNISGVLLSPSGRRHLVSSAGIVGHQLHRLHPLTLPWPLNALLILHTDGLGTHWNLDDYPGLTAHDPSLIAGVLHRDFKRGRDDTAVVALKAGEA